MTEETDQETCIIDFDFHDQVFYQDQEFENCIFHIVNGQLCDELKKEGEDKIRQFAIEIKNRYLAIADYPVKPKNHQIILKKKKAENAES